MPLATAAKVQRVKQGEGERRGVIKYQEAIMEDMNLDRDS